MSAQSQKRQFEPNWTATQLASIETLVPTKQLPLQNGCFCQVSCTEMKPEGRCCHVVLTRVTRVFDKADWKLSKTGNVWNEKGKLKDFFSFHLHIWLVFLVAFHILPMSKTDTLFNTHAHKVPYKVSREDLVQHYTARGHTTGLASRYIYTLYI